MQMVCLISDRGFTGRDEPGAKNAIVDFGAKTRVCTDCRLQGYEGDYVCPEIGQL